MKIKYSPSPIYNIILAVIFVYTGMFNIITIPILSNGTFQNMFIFIAACGLFFNSLTNLSLRKKASVYSRFFYIMLFYLVVFIIIHCIYSYGAYGENFRDLYATARQILNLLFFLPFIYIIHSNNGYEKLLKDITAMTFVLLAIKTFKALVYNFTGITILGAISNSIRHGRMRIGLTAFGGIVFIFCLYKAMELPKKTRAFYWYSGAVAFIMLYELYINMTRANIIAYFVTFFVMIIIQKRPKGKKLLIVILAAAVIFVLVITGVIGNFLNTFSESDNELGASTVARNYAVSYFATVTDKNPIVGMSFLVPNTPIRYEIFFGPAGAACLDDVGIVNMYYHYGITGIILAVLVLGRMLYCAIIAILSKSEKSIIIIGILVFLGLTQISLCAFDGQRILALPLYWAIFEYEYYICGKGKRKKFNPPKLNVRLK